jgi:hypothetical protein
MGTRNGEARALQRWLLSRAGILVSFSESSLVYSLRERYTSHHLWMRRPDNSDTLLYGRFGKIPFRPALLLRPKHTVAAKAKQG